MSDNSAGTKVCERCGGSGNNRGGDCPWCSGAGIDTTGAVVGVLPPAVGIGGYVYAPDHNSGATVTDDRDATIAAQAAEIEIVTTDRDVLRLEVQRLKDLNFEAQDLYAAIEAERDELRAEAERLKLRLTESLVELCAAEKEIAHMRESNGRADDYSAKLERVIEALRYELAGVVHCHTATIRSIVRLANAGLELPEVADNE